MGRACDTGANDDRCGRVDRRFRHEVPVRADTMVRMPPSAAGTALMAGVLLLGSCGWQPTRYPEHAPDLYNHYCATCHGLEGRGDGPVAAALSPPPADLTRSTARIPELMRVIDGRRTVRAHGTAAMPVWGEIFERSLIGEPRRRRQALEQVRALAEYVRRMQVGGPVKAT
jgi:mono/diheme cytochrome c family protein